MTPPLYRSGRVCKVYTFIRKDDSCESSLTIYKQELLSMSQGKAEAEQMAKKADAYKEYNKAAKVTTRLCGPGFESWWTAWITVHCILNLMTERETSFQTKKRTKRQCCGTGSATDETIQFPAGSPNFFCCGTQICTSTRTVEGIQDALLCPIEK